MNDMKQPWDAGTGRGGGMMEDRWQQPTHGPHLWWAQPAPGKRFGTGDRCAHMHTGYVRRCQNTQPPTKHLQSEDILSKGCVYCRINHQLFHYIIHVLSRPHLYPRASYSFFFFLFPSTSHSLRLSYSDHAPIQTPVTIQLNPQFPPAAAHPVRELSRVWKWGYFRDSSILESKKQAESAGAFFRFLYAPEEIRPSFFRLISG